MNTGDETKWPNNLCGNCQRDETDCEHRSKKRSLRWSVPWTIRRVESVTWESNSSNIRSGPIKRLRLRCFFIVESTAASVHNKNWAFVIHSWFIRWIGSRSGALLCSLWEALTSGNSRVTCSKNCLPTNLKPAFKHVTRGAQTYPVWRGTVI